MKNFIKPIILPFATLAGAFLTMMMRFWLTALGKDERGLLPAGTFPDIMSWILTALVIVLLFLGTRRLNEATKYTFNFPASMRAAGGIILGALGVLITVLVELFTGAPRLGIFNSVLGLIAVGVLAFVAFCRIRGMKPSFLFHSYICIFLMFYLIAHYRLWSSYPQHQAYAFELMALVFLMLASYQRAAFEGGIGNRKAYTFYSLGALFFCIAALPGATGGAFYIGCAAWMFTTPCSLKPLCTQSDKNEA